MRWPGQGRCWAWCPAMDEARSPSMDVRFDLTAFCTEATLAPAELASAVEQEGFDVLLFPDHTHVPVDRATRSRAAARCRRTTATSTTPFIAFAFAASATTALRVGVGVCLVPAREPIALAKEVATVDALSKRFLFGVGAGWNAEELANHGVALGDHARPHPRHEGDLGRRRRLVRGRARPPRPAVVGAEAAPTTTPADPRRRPRTWGAGARGRLRRRVAGHGGARATTPWRRGLASSMRSLGPPAGVGWRSRSRSTATRPTSATLTTTWLRASTESTSACPTSDRARPWPRSATWAAWSGAITTGP
jgi:alkanesulfonate monooxygenase SsuD/methylene tetrahydromethanopterin reductase-like flavin-dependent oxidoreductase (luciferase family)